MKLFLRGIAIKIERRLLKLYAWLYYTYTRPKLDCFIYFGHGIGDDLLCTIVIKQLKAEKKYDNIWMLTHHPVLFRKSPDVAKVINLKRIRYRRNTKFFRILAEQQNIQFYTPTYCSRTDRNKDPLPEKHVIEVMCEKVGVGPPPIFKPHLYIHERKDIYVESSPKKRIAIQVTGRSSVNYMSNKEWYFDRFQAIVNHFKEDFTFVQVGSINDPLLVGVIDKRGTPLEETAQLLSQSFRFIGLEGMLMHLARAVDCLSIIIFGGRSQPGQIGYSENVNIHSSPACSPCWWWNKCDNGKSCMESITSDHVISQIENNLKLG